MVKSFLKLPPKGDFFMSSINCRPSNLRSKVHFLDVIKISQIFKIHYYLLYKYYSQLMF